MKKIYEGYLGETPVYMRVLSLADLEEVLALQIVVYDFLEDKEILQPLSREEFEYILNNNGIMIGVYTEDDTMIAFRALLDPPVDEEHLGYDCGIPEADFHKILYHEISNVSPKFRGFGLQKLMAKVAMEQVNTTKYDYLCSTVKPLNIPSLKDKFSQGMIVKALKIKYVDKLRYVFFKDLTGVAPIYTEQKQIEMADILAQQQALKEGFDGTKMFQQNDVWYVTYEK